MQGEYMSERYEWNTVTDTNLAGTASCSSASSAPRRRLIRFLVPGMPEITLDDLRQRGWIPLTVYVFLFRRAALSKLLTLTPGGLP